MTETTKSIIKKKVKAHIPKYWLKELRIVYRIALETIHCIKRTGWINLAIITTIAAILTIFGALFRTSYSLSSFVDKLGDAFEISVYLKQGKDPVYVASRIRRWSVVVCQIKMTDAFVEGVQEHFATA